MPELPGNERKLNPTIENRKKIIRKFHVIASGRKSGIYGSFTTCGVKTWEGETAERGIKLEEFKKRSFLNVF